MYLTIKSCYLGPFDVYPTPKIGLSFCSLVCSSPKSYASYKGDACTMRPLSKSSPVVRWSSSPVYDAVIKMMMIIICVRCSLYHLCTMHPCMMLLVICVGHTAWAPEEREGRSQEAQRASIRGPLALTRVRGLEGP